MRFEKIHRDVPYVHEGKLKSIQFFPYNDISLAMPGKHAMDTSPIGGDFVVRVHDEGMGWEAHEFTHTDIFKDVDAKARADKDLTHSLMKDYLGVIIGTEVPDWTDASPVWDGTLHPETFLQAVQCLAVAEHRRYHQYEAKFGGRFLPFRYAAGIAEGLWTAMDAVDKQRRGRPGVEQLERQKGMPTLTKALMLT